MFLSGHPMVKLLETRRARMPQAYRRAEQLSLLAVLVALLFSDSAESRIPVCWLLIFSAPLPGIFRFLKVVKETAPGERCFPLRPREVLDGFAWHSVVSVLQAAWWTVPILITCQVLTGRLAPSLLLPYLLLGWLGLLCSALAQSYFWVAVTIRPWQVMLAYFGCSWYAVLPALLTRPGNPASFSTPIIILITPLLILGATAVLREIGGLAYEQSEHAPPGAPARRRALPSPARRTTPLWALSLTARVRSLWSNPILLRELDRGSKRPLRWLLWRLPVLGGLACAAQYHLKLQSPESFVALSFVALGLFSFALAALAATRLLGQDLAPGKWETLRQTGLNAREFIQGTILSAALPRLIELVLPLMVLAHVAVTRGLNPLGLMLPATFALVAPFLGATLTVRGRIGLPGQAHRYHPYTRSLSLMYSLLCMESQLLFKTSSLWFLGVPPLALLEAFWLWNAMAPLLNQTSLMALAPSRCDPRDESPAGLFGVGPALACAMNPGRAACPATAPHDHPPERALQPG